MTFSCSGPGSISYMSMAFIGSVQEAELTTLILPQPDRLCLSTFFRKHWRELGCWARSDLNQYPAKRSLARNRSLRYALFVLFQHPQFEERIWRLS